MIPFKIIKNHTLSEESGKSIFWNEKSEGFKLQFQV